MKLSFGPLYSEVARWPACLESFDWGAMNRLHEKGIFCIQSARPIGCIYYTSVSPGPRKCPLSFHEEIAGELGGDMPPAKFGLKDCAGWVPVNQLAADVGPAELLTWNKTD